MIELGLRDCGLHPRDFWDLTLRELALIIEGR
ncbi:MAG: phage tail assembly chaperone, partial [Candidatus Nanopelagicaceae bacterium]